MLKKNKKTEKWDLFLANDHSLKIALPYEDNLRYILFHISDIKIKKRLIEELVNITEYDPFQSPIPLHRLSSSLSTYIQKIQTKMKFQKGLAFQFCRAKMNTLHYKNQSMTYLFVQRKEDLFLPEYFELGVHFLIVYIKNVYYIYLNPNERISPLSIYKQLKYVENDVWYLSLENKMIYTTTDLHSQLSAKRIVQLIEDIKKEEE